MFGKRIDAATTIGRVKGDPDDDDDDGDYQMDSEDLDLATSMIISEGEDKSNEESRTENEKDSDFEDDDELQVEDHPLLWSGIFPRLGRGVIDLVVGTVEDDMKNSSSQ